MQKDWKNVVCTSCGLVNEYTITVKSNQRVCICNGCGHFLGNKPKDDYDVNIQRMPFGKYKGELVIEIDDKDYLTWFLGNCKLSGGLKAAVTFKLNK